MVTGRVTERENTLKPVAEIVVLGRSNLKARVQAVVDTGFTQHLTLPARAIAALDLELIFKENLRMANDESVHLDVYSGVIEWNGQHRHIEIHSTEGDSLIGMEMLRNHDLHIRAVPQGNVTIQPVA